MKLLTLLTLGCLSVSLPAQQNPKSMKKVGTVDTRFQSYNVEMAEIIGGKFWKPYAPLNSAPSPGSPFEQRNPIDLGNSRLRKLAAALGPAYVRVSGSWANTVHFQDSDAPPPATPPPGFSGVLTRTQWKGLILFAKAADAKIVTSFAASEGTRNASGIWQPEEARALLRFTTSNGSSIAAAEFVNEPTFIAVSGLPKGYDAAAYGKDFAVFHDFLREEAPGALLLGPSAVGEGFGASPMKLLPAADLLVATQKDPLDAFSYHFYGAASQRCESLGESALTTAQAALTEDWLARTSIVEAFYAGLRDRYAPGKPMWLTESGQAACGGDRWAATFLDSFHYADELGRLARQHVQVVMHNTLAASDYGLIDDVTLMPRPDYWTALLWHKTMGTTVLDPGKSPSDSLHLYAHCMRDQPGGVTLLALNFGTSNQSIPMPQPSSRFTLTATDLTGNSVQLNGTTLALTATDDMPPLGGVPTPSGSVDLPSTSITFLTMKGAANAACR